MGDVSKGEGRTVLFVSHNMAAVKNLCNNGIYLKNGMIFLNDSIEKVIESYNVDNTGNLSQKLFYKAQQDKILRQVKIVSKNNNIFVNGDFIEFDIELAEAFNDIDVHLGIYNLNDEKVINLSTEYFSNIDKNKTKFICHIENNPLVEGTYYVHVFLKNKIWNEFHSKVLQFDVLNGDYYKQGKLIEKIPSLILVDHEWK